MKVNSLIVLCSLFAMMMLTGCPRDTDADANASGISSNTAAETTDSIATNAAGTLDAVAKGGDGQDAETADDTPAGGEGEATADSAEGDAAVAEDELGAEMTAETDKGPVTMVVLETSKGDVVLEVHSDWSPLGAAHFLELVEAGFYDGAPWFRVFKDPGGISVAQCGIAADPKVTAQWQQKTIMDEPVIMGNKQGTVAFGKSAYPNSRSTHIFVNLSDNAFALDPQGFSCFAVIVEGYDIVDSLKETGSSAVDQGRLSSQGIDYFYQVVPDGDIIKKAYIRE